MGIESVVAAILALVLVVYMLTGGADFGGGALDLFAFGPRKDDQRAAIVDAIAPIWEANHVWLILVIVMLFVCFPVGFAAISTALHIPLTIMLLGIVARGSAFVFRQYDSDAPRVRRRWGRVFAGGSLVTPFAIGLTIAAVGSGSIRLEEGLVTTGFFAGWTSPYAIAVGAFMIAQVTFLAATYLANETTEALQEDFRKHGLIWGALLGVTALVSLLMARAHAPTVFHWLSAHHLAIPFQVTTALVAVGALASLYTRRFRLARMLAAAQVTLIVCGGMGAQYPYLLAPDLTFQAAAAPPNIQRMMLIILACGSVVLVPALYWLMRVFKTGVLLRER